MTATVATCQLRPVTPADEPLRRLVHRSTRADELAGLGWPEATIEQFCGQQYDVRAAAFRLAFPNAEYAVIVDALGNDVGELIVDTAADTDSDTMVVVDIAVLPEHRNTGLGTAVLEDLIARADGARRIVELTVERTNPARSLYERLGFEIVETDDLHHRMRREATRKESA